MKEVMNRDEVLEYLGISVATLYRWILSGLKYSKIGRRVFFTKDDVMAFINANKICEYKR